MQDRNRQLDENLLQRAAGPYIRVIRIGLPPARDFRSTPVNSFPGVGVTIRRSINVEPIHSGGDKSVEQKVTAIELVAYEAPPK
jgi:hypothetical protein